MVLFGGGGAGLLLEGGGEQPGGFGTQEYFREGEVAAGGFVAHHARGQSDGAERGEPVEGAPALGAEAVGVLGQPSLLEGGEGLEVEWASGGAGGTGPSTGQMSSGVEPIRSLVESKDGPVAPGAEYRSSTAELHTMGLAIVRALSCLLARTDSARGQSAGQGGSPVR